MHERRHKKLILKRADLPTATEAGDNIASEITIIKGKKNVNFMAKNNGDQNFT